MDQGKALLERSRKLVEQTQSAILRARATTIQAQHVAQAARAIRYENHLIRAAKR